MYYCVSLVNVISLYALKLDLRENIWIQHFTNIDIGNIPGDSFALAIEAESALANLAASRFAFLPRCVVGAATPVLATVADGGEGVLKETVSKSMAFPRKDMVDCLARASTWDWATAAAEVRA